MTVQPAETASGRAVERRGGSGLAAAIRVMRARQWIKNLLVFAGPLFGGVLGGSGVLARALLTFAAFCLASSATYALNDVVDADEDRQHPVKSRRPVASGALGRRPALTLATLLALLSLALALTADRSVALLDVIYLALITVYCLWGRERQPVDVFIIAAGFVLRALAGAAAAHVQPSVWLLALTILLALLLGFGKRRAEVALVGPGAAGMRPSLRGYTVEMLDQALSMLAGSAIVLYAIYTVSISQRLGSADMIVTWPLVVIGMLHYLRLSHTTTRPPDELLVSDRTLLVIVLAFGLLAGAVLYLHPNILAPVHL